MRFGTRAELSAWLEAHGLSHVERISLEAAASRLDESLWSRLAAITSSAGSRRLLVELVTDEGNAGWEPRLVEAAARVLDDALRDATCARADVARLAPPEGPTALELHGRLLRLRETFPPSVAPRVKLPALQVEPTGFRMEEPQPYASERGVFVRPVVQLVIDDAAPSVTCTCGLAPCVHRLATIDAALAWLHGAAEPLLRELARPSWERTLRELQEVLDDEAPARGVELIFRLRVVDEAVEVEAWVHRHGKEGQRGAGKRTTKRALLLEHGPRLAPEDAKIASLLSDGVASRALLESLIAHPRLVLADDPERIVRIDRATIGLVAEARNGAVRVTAGLEGAPLPPSLLERARRGRPDDVLFVWDAGRLTLLDLQVELRALLRVLARNGELFPAAAQPALIDSLSRWAQRVPVVLPRGLMGEQVPVDTRPVVRLTQEGDEVLVEVLARPLPEAATFVPGHGARDVHVRRGDRALHAVRDLERERRAAQALIDTLPLRAGQVRPFAWRFDDVQDVLALVAACAEQAPQPELVWVGTPLRIVGRARAEALKVAVVRKREWFGVLGGLSVAGERVELARLLEAARKKQRWVISESKSYLEVTKELHKLLGALSDHARVKGHSVEIGAAAIPSLHALAHAGASIDPDERWRELSSRIQAASSAAPQVPHTLQAELRPYQRDGFEWLARLAAWGGGGILADDMGLGKTVQALALLLYRASEGPALVVAPTSVAFNWRDEARRFAPSLKLHLYADALDRQALLRGLGAGDVLVVSYALMTRDLAGRRFATVIFDEAQNLKNPATRRARSARTLDADARFALSGTPIENHLGELWSLFSIVFPSLLGPWDGFREQHALPIERGIDADAAARLARIIAPFLLRRTKLAVETELPPRTEVRVPVVLSTTEWTMYEDARLATLSDLETRRSVMKEQERRVDILAALTRLRLMASHPRLHDRSSDVASSKLERFLTLVDELRAESQRALVFSQFTSHLALVREALDARGIAYEYLDGSTPRKARERHVRAFQEGHAPLFLVSLKAGGSGLNLTAATNVIHLDPWWNPAVEDQASDRAHRLGQTKPVTIYRLVALGTIEETMVGLHAHKRALVDTVLRETARVGKVSASDLLRLLAR
ncbi:MAG: DEAD/DEAH box helicase [Polyangia bacterium]